MFTLMRNILILIIFVGAGVGLILRQPLQENFEHAEKFTLEVPLKNDLSPSTDKTSTPTDELSTQKPTSSLERVTEKVRLEESLATPALPRFPTEGTFAPINSRAREAVVNILCEKISGTVKETTSGSGVIIDPRGFVLTSAHVAHFLLLETLDHSNKIDCVLKVGNPARDAYKAELVFITERWVETYAPQLGSPEPRGTGEEDFALLYITDSALSTHKLPQTFPFLPLQENATVKLDEQVLVVGYPIFGLNTAHAIKNLYLVSGLATISELFTFNEDTFDLFSINNTIAAEHGVSGGAIITEEGAIAGIVVTSSADALILDRALNALSINYVNRRMEEETGSSLSEFLLDDPRTIERRFKNNYLPSLLEKFPTES